MAASPFLSSIVGFALTLGCGHSPAPIRAHSQVIAPKRQIKNPGKVIHVIVALCDNKYQGIVPVPAKLGNGDDLASNLYWGSSYGVKAFFRAQRDWEMIPVKPNKGDAVLEQVVFKHKRKPVYLFAQAYRGREIKQATARFFDFAGGSTPWVIEIGDKKKQKLAVGGGADMIAYVGHDGLMDFNLDRYPVKADDRKRDAAIFACKSKQFFAPALKKTGVNPLVWTTNLMAPEAYVLKAAVDGWIARENGNQIKERVAQAYHQYQRCGIKGARNTFATGW